MGVINAENNLTYRSSSELFARIRSKLSSYNSLGLIDDGEFYDHVMHVLKTLGLAVYKECEAVVCAKNGRASLPNNFYMFHAAFKCTPGYNEAPSINEQKPLIYYTDTEISKECTNKCIISCGPDEGKTKFVIRTYVNGDNNDCRTYHNPILLKLSPNVKGPCTDDSLSLFCAGKDEVTLDVDNKSLYTKFDGPVYVQYYGIPFDHNELPMIPDQEEIEKAIEYYIYAQVFEFMMWNNVVPNLVTILADARQLSDYHMAQARYWSRLPSFQRMVQSIRRDRSRKKFFYFPMDKTIIRNG